MLNDISGLPVGVPRPLKAGVGMDNLPRSGSGVHCIIEYLHPIPELFHSRFSDSESELFLVYKKRGKIDMLVKCQNCGQTLSVGGLGRKRLNHSVKNVCDALLKYCSVAETAKQLGCSRAYIYKILKTNGLKLKDIKAL